MDGAAEAGLGRLERVDLRDIWKSESGNFTPWLARDETIALLGETLGMELEVNAVEKDVGPFRADILCLDAAEANSESWVVIENQLSPTDHVHLGQLLTYAAGLRATTTVWIAQQFRDEHRAVLDYLNEITGDDHSFFGCTVSLWRIGESAIAPQFRIAASPNQWSRDTKPETAEVSETGALYRRYWTEFARFVKEHNSTARTTKPLPQHWMNIAIGRTYFKLVAFLQRQQQRVGVELYISGPQPHTCLDHLRDDTVIESTLGPGLKWRHLPKSGQLRLVSPDPMHPEDPDDWPRQHRWLAETLEKFDRVLRPRIADISVLDSPPGE